MVKHQHYAPHVVHQRVTVRERGGGSPRRGGGSVVTQLALRERQTYAFGDVFGDRVSLGFHRRFRPDAYLTPDQLWQVYKLNGDVRAAVDSIARRVASEDWLVQPTVKPEVDEEKHNRGLAQAEYVKAALEQPNEDDDWQTFTTKLVVDALVFWHGAIENAFGRALAGSEVVRGAIAEFVPVYGPSVHPLADPHNRITGWAHDPTGGRGGIAAGGGRDPRGWVVLDKDQITRLSLFPNTRSQYAEPPIETIVREATTLVRSSERTMYAMDRNEVPTGFLIMTGATPQGMQTIQDQAEAQASQGHKIRILHTMGAQAPATWLRITQDFQEVAYADVVRESRKTVWRVFGVTPIEMGDTTDANRASSDAEIEVGDSHLVEPLLEALARIVNRRMVPLLVERFEREKRRGGSGEIEVLCAFGWDDEEGQTPEEEKQAAEAAGTRLNSGITTINEERERLGLPAVEGGHLVRIGGKVLAEAGDTDPDPDDDPEDPDDGEVDPEAAEAAEEGAEAARVYLGPPSMDRRPPRLALAGAGAAMRAPLGADDLPSAWQQPGIFSDVRTIDLVGLWGLVSGYRQTVAPLWRQARQQVLAATGAAWRRGTVGSSDHLQRIDAALRELREGWSAGTRSLYLQAGELGALGAREITGDTSVGSQAEAQAVVYFESAMSYLGDLLGSVSTRLATYLGAVRSSRADPDLDDELEAELRELLEAVEQAFDAEEHRIDNWSGKLVEAANLAAVGAVLAASTSATAAGETVIAEEEQDGDGGGAGGPHDGGEPAVEWWVAWEHVGDNRMCATCEREGMQGIRPLSALPTVPGGATECRARCRCVLVYWTQKEVQDGTAHKIN